MHRARAKPGSPLNAPAHAQQHLSADGERRSSAEGDAARLQAQLSHTEATARSHEQHTTAARKDLAALRAQTLARDQEIAELAAALKTARVRSLLSSPCSSHLLNLARLHLQPTPSALVQDDCDRLRAREAHAQRTASDARGEQERMITELRVAQRRVQIAEMERQRQLEEQREALAAAEADAAAVACDCDAAESEAERLAAQLESADRTVDALLQQRDHEQATASQLRIALDRALHARSSSPRKQGSGEAAAAALSRAVVSEEPACEAEALASCRAADSSALEAQRDETAAEQAAWRAQVLEALEACQAETQAANESLTARTAQLTSETQLREAAEASAANACSALEALQAHAPEGAAGAALSIQEERCAAGWSSRCQRTRSRGDRFGCRSCCHYREGRHRGRSGSGAGRFKCSTA